MRFVTCRLPDGVEDPAILSQDGTQVWPLSWLGLSYETLSDAIPFLTPQVRFAAGHQRHPRAAGGGRHPAKPHPQPCTGRGLSGHQLHGTLG